MTWEELKKANELIQTMSIERFNKKQGKMVSKEYAEVNQRIKAFRSVYPDGFITTHIHSLENGVCVMHANVGYYSGDRMVVLGTGFAYEKEGASDINKTSYIENCETSAVGRALGMCGFGIDTSVASYEEVSNAIAQQNEVPMKPAEKPAHGDLSGERIAAEKIGATAASALAVLIAETGTSIEKVLKAYGAEALTDLTMGQWKDCMDTLTKRKEKAHEAV